MATNTSHCVLLQEHRTEIDAHGQNFQAIESFGLQLLGHGHYMQPEIQEKLDSIKAEREALERQDESKSAGAVVGV